MAAVAVTALVLASGCTSNQAPVTKEPTSSTSAAAAADAAWVSSVSNAITDASSDSPAALASTQGQLLSSSNGSAGTISVLHNEYSQQFTNATYVVTLYCVGGGSGTVTFTIDAASADKKFNCTATPVPVQVELTASGKVSDVTVTASSGVFAAAYRMTAS